jgi:hypothetical protein
MLGPSSALQLAENPTPMLAYVFWHRPYPNTEHKRYEQAIVRFQNDLAGSKPPGFIGATSFQIEAVP